jgi:RecA/RadA recombinase
MAKKKDTSNVSPAEVAAARAAKHITSIKNPEDRPKMADPGSGLSGVIGLKIPFPLQYILGCGVLPLGIVMEINGAPQSCKSMFAYELGRMFAESGGWLEFIVTEGKISKNLAYSVMGWEPERRKAFFPYMAQNMKVWQSLMQERIGQTIDMVERGDSASGMPPGATYPVMFCVDSIMGANLPETEKRINDDGFAGRSFPAEALSLTTYLKRIANMVMPYPFLAAFINHLKITESDDAYTPAKKSRPGGKQLRFSETFEIQMYRRASETALDKSSGAGAEIHRRLIEMEVAKNSIGTDGRKIQVYVSWKFQSIGNGMSIQRTKWDWNEATTRMLANFQAGKMTRIKSADTSLRNRLDEFFHLRKLTNNRYASDFLGIPSSDPLSAGEMGALINSRDDAIQALRTAFGIPAYHTWQPGTDYAEQRREVLGRETEQENMLIEALRSEALTSGLDIDDLGDD